MGGASIFALLISAHRLLGTVHSCLLPRVISTCATVCGICTVGINTYMYVHLYSEYAHTHNTQYGKPTMLYWYHLPCSVTLRCLFILFPVCGMPGVLSGSWGSSLPRKCSVNRPLGSGTLLCMACSHKDRC